MDAACSAFFARLADDKGQVLSISAREGRFLANKEDRNTIILRLADGTIIHDVEDGPPRVLSFSQHDLPIDLPALEDFRARGADEQEYILPELLKIGWSPQSSADQRAASQANFNFRMVEVVMMILLPLMALALAIPPKRSTSSLGVFVSIVIVVAYHKVNQYGAEVAAIGRGRSVPCPVGALRAARSDDLVDVLSGRLRSRRAGVGRA